MVPKAGPVGQATNRPALDARGQDRNRKIEELDMEHRFVMGTSNNYHSSFSLT